MTLEIGNAAPRAGRKEWIGLAVIAIACPAQVESGADEAVATGTAAGRALEPALAEC